MPRWKEEGPGGNRYEYPGAFRKIFLKLLGLSPGEYRRRFFVGEDAPDGVLA